MQRHKIILKHLRPSYSSKQRSKGKMIGQQTVISTRSSPNCNLSTAQVTMLMHPVKKWTTFIIQKTRLSPEVTRINPNSASRFRPDHSEPDFFLNQPVKNVPLPASLNLISLSEFKLLLLKSIDCDKGIPHWSTQGPLIVTQHCNTNFNLTGCITK